MVVAELAEQLAYYIKDGRTKQAERQYRTYAKLN
jgi:hypothetical protein